MFFTKDIKKIKKKSYILQSLGQLNVFWTHLLYISKTFHLAFLTFTSVLQQTEFISGFIYSFILAEMGFKHSLNFVLKIIENLD